MDLAQSHAVRVLSPAPALRHWAGVITWRIAVPACHFRPKPRPLPLSKSLGGCGGLSTGTVQ